MNKLILDEAFSFPHTFQLSLSTHRLRPFLHLSKTKLSLSLLGKFKLLRDGKPITTVDSPRLQSLLAFLALNKGVPQSRAGLAYELWPDSTESQALTNLRNQLHALRKGLPEANEAIVADKKTLCWNDDSLATDVSKFLESIENAKEAPDPAQSALLLSHALTLYEGPLLPSCYDDWIIAQRDKMDSFFHDASKRLVAIQVDLGDYESAISLVKRLVREEPENESYHRQLMQLYEKNGDRASALAAYRECVTILQEELNIGPSQDTRNLHARLLADHQDSSSQRGNKTLPAKPELPLQGRKRELGLLKKQWNHSMDKRAQLTLLIGEAGIGKSRLAEELYYWVAKQGFTVAKTRSYAAEGNLAYAPLAHWLRNESLFEGVKQLGTTHLEELARLLPELKRDFPALTDSPQSSGNQQAFFEALSQAFGQHQGPLLLVLDDLQWTDRESLNWIQHFLRFANDKRIMLLGTIRDEELPDNPELQRFLTKLAGDELATEIRLGRLDRTTSSLIAADVTGQTLAETQTETLYTETEGNPLFIIESMRATRIKGTSRKSGSEQTDSPVSIPSSLPQKVRSVFVSRLDQLSETSRELVGVAAVLGRAFSFELISLIVKQDDETIVDSLEELWQRRIITEQDNGTYDFSHDKMREVAYAELSPPRRRFLHRKSAQALNIRYLYNLDIIQARVGTHYENAGETEKAIRAYTNAGNHAKLLNANNEATRLFKKGLELARQLPTNRASLETELDLILTLGECYSLDSETEDEMKAAYRRAKEISEALGKKIDDSILTALNDGRPR